MTENKKPIWEKWYMIILYVFVGLIVLGIMFGEDGAELETSTNTEESLGEDFSETSVETEEDTLNADASDGRIHLWLLDSRVETHSETCIFLSGMNECHIFEIRIQNDGEDSVLVGNLFSWSAWSGGGEFMSEGTEGPEKVRSGGTTEIEVYFEMEEGKKIDGLIYEYGFNNKIELDVPSYK